MIKLKDLLLEITWVNTSGELEGDITFNQLPLNLEVKKYINKMIKDAINDGEFDHLISFGYFDTELPIHLLQKFNGEIIEKALGTPLEDPEDIEDLDLDDEIEKTLYTSISDNVKNYIKNKVQLYKGKINLNQ
tara:strand:+ start:907 stop:1305 length:399 start_codon:yes stop_codon:yes gene_type:complete